MLRTHRLLRLVHRLRVERFVYAAESVAYDALEEWVPFIKPMLSLHDDGISNGHVLDEIISSYSRELERKIRELLPGSGTGPGRSGRTAGLILSAYVQRRGEKGRFGAHDRDVTYSCAALAQTLVLDRLVRATEVVLRRRAQVDHRRTPRWPAAYVERQREAAEVVGQGELLVEGEGGPKG